MDVTKLTTRSAIPCGYPPGAEPFLAAISADRDDDTPRLVFADWLQENGDEERAEFIRIQCELYRVNPRYALHPAARDAFTPDLHAKFNRQLELAQQNRAAWTSGLTLGMLTGSGPGFTRGFPCRASADPARWREYGERVRAWVPLEAVFIDGTADRYPELLSLPTLIGLNELYLHRAGDAELRALAQSAALDSLEWLSVVGRDSNGTVETPVLRSLFGNPRLSGLRGLFVEIDRAGDTLGFVVGGSPHLRNLRSLHLNDGMRREAARELFDSPNMANVTELALPGNPIGDRAARDLVRSKYLTRLTSLDLRDAGLTVASARILAAWPGLRTISALLLDGNNLGPEGEAVLAASPYAKREN